MSFHLVDATYCLGERGIGGIHAVVQHSSAGRAGTDVPFVDARRRRSVYAFPSRSHLLSSRAFVSCHVRESVGHVHFHVHFSLAVRALNHDRRVRLPHVQRRRQKRNVTWRFATKKRAKRRASATCRSVSAPKECIWFVPTAPSLTESLGTKGVHLNGEGAPVRRCVCYEGASVGSSLPPNRGVSASTWGASSPVFSSAPVPVVVVVHRWIQLGWWRDAGFGCVRKQKLRGRVGEVDDDAASEREHGDNDQNGRRWRAFQAEFEGVGVGRSPTPFTRQMDGSNHHLGWNTWGRERPYTSRIH